MERKNAFLACCFKDIVPKMLVWRNQGFRTKGDKNAWCRRVAILENDGIFSVPVIVRVLASEFHSGPVSLYFGRTKIKKTRCGEKNG